MILISVYDEPRAPKLLWDMLAERTQEQSISHKEMPSPRQHMQFYMRRPYPNWYLIDPDHCAQEYVGNIYLTHNREVGIHILNRYQGKGYGTAALRRLREIVPGQILANINPKNEASIKFFQKHGGVLIQHTYEL